MGTEQKCMVHNLWPVSKLICLTKNILKSIFKVLKKTQGYYQVPKLRNIPTMFGTTIAITITSTTTTTTQGLWSYGERSLRKPQGSIMSQNWEIHVILLIPLLLLILLLLLLLLLLLVVIVVVAVVVVKS